VQRTAETPGDGRGLDEAYAIFAETSTGEKAAEVKSSRRREIYLNPKISEELQCIYRLIDQRPILRGLLPGKNQKGCSSPPGTAEF
jgi:hypothetical protein